MLIFIQSHITKSQNELNSIHSVTHKEKIKDLIIQGVMLKTQGI